MRKRDGRARDAPEEALNRVMRRELFEDPPLPRAVFGSTLFAWVWLPLRLFLGWEWLSHDNETLSYP